MKDGIKHFLFVGVGFALVAGWILTLIVNTLLEMLLQAILGAPPTDFYLGSLFLTVVSISLIAVCEIGGNRLFRSRLVSPGFGFSSIVASTLFFIVLVLAFVLPEFSQVIRRCADNARYFYQHSSELFLMLSLPLARLVILPAVHFCVARAVLCSETNT
jgi:hypothetical protein